MSKVVYTGEKPGHGQYFCTNCGTDVCLNDSDKMPPCPACSNTAFRKGSGCDCGCTK